jgi:hypothetical protein
MVNVSDAQRRQLHAGLVEKIGADVADTLMDYLPHAGWSDLARKSDLDALESRLKAKISDLRTEMHEGFASQTRWFVGSQLVLVIAVIGSITTIAH